MIFLKSKFNFKRLVMPFFIVVFLMSIFVVSLSKISYAKFDKTISVLYIGNSLTSYNNLPLMIANLAESNNYSIVYESHAIGGRDLAGHAFDKKLLEKIKKQSWDFVVLQEQSQLPSFSHEQVQKDVYPYVKLLSQKIKAANSKSTVVLYQTMANRNGNLENAHIIPELKTYEGVQDRINDSYMVMAKSNRALIAPVGKVWKKVRSQNRSINLYSDDVHPNVVGSYLAACVFYATFFQETLSELSYPPQIDEKTAELFHDIVNKIVFGIYPKWDWSQ